MADFVVPSRFAVPITVRTRRVNPFARKLAWCCGCVLAAEGPDGVAGDLASLGLDVGDYVNVMLQTGLTRTPGGLHEDDMVELTRHLARQLGLVGRLEKPQCMVVTLMVERRELEINKRGAVILHAVELLSVQSDILLGSDDEGDFDDETMHREDKDQRHLIFAQWLLETFGKERLSDGRGVLEIAAGKGLLSSALRELVSNVASTASRGSSLPCTLVEPVCRDCTQAGGEVSLLDKELAATDPFAATTAPCWLFETFDSVDFPERHPEVLSECSIIIGLHPDQATEAIVDCALRWNKPFALVPCCVYPSLFPDRRRSTGQGVVSYGAFIKYLREKHPDIQSTRLPFKGRNRVLYHFGSTPPPAG